jgi:hypothetical protein
LIVRLKRSAWMLFAAAALMVTALAAMEPGVAEAGAEAQQRADEAAITSIPQSTDQNTNNPDSNQSVTAATPIPETAASRVVVVNPGDSLWSIAQERLGPEATPGQVEGEVWGIYGLNRDRIGDDPNLILAGQELFLPPPEAGSGPNDELAQPTPAEPGPSATEPAVSEPGAADQRPAAPATAPVAAEAAPQPGEESAPETTASEQPAPEQPAVAPEANRSAGAPARSPSPPDNTNRRAFGLGILALSLLLLLTLVVDVARSLRKGRERPYVSPHYYDTNQRGQEREEDPRTAAGASEAAPSGGGTTEPEAETSPEIPTAPSGYVRSRRRLRAQRLRARRNGARSKHEGGGPGGGW